MQKTLKLGKLAICILMIMAIAIAYAPVNCETASAASFSKSTKVTSVKVVKVRPTSITLAWKSLSGADGYQIYRKSSKHGRYVKIKTTTKHYYRRYNLTTNKTCWYKVRAYKNTEDGRIYSKFSVKVKAKPTLAKPTLTTKAGNYSIVLKWKKVEGASGYQIYRSTRSNGGFKKIATTKKLVLKNTDIVKGKVYYYKVRAYKVLKNKRRVGKCSIVKSCATLVTGTTTTAATTTAPTTTTTVPTATAKTTTTTTTTRATTTTKATTTKATTTTTKATTQAIKIDKPAAPKNVAVKGFEDYAKISWSEVSNATGYEVYRSTSSTGNYTKLGRSKRLFYKDSSVKNGNTYYYKVRAYRTVSGQTAYGNYNSNKYSRDVMVKYATAWLGYKESNGTHKQIIDVYNSNLKPGGWKMTYNLPWCATYVSAVGIKAGYTDIIYRDTYCPTMMGSYKSAGTYSSNKKYIPKAGDIVFYDWNYNAVPDHVGMVVSATSSTVKVIEGNKNDAVEYRTYSPGYCYLLSYGLPKYDGVCGIKFNGTSSTSAVGEAATEQLENVGISSTQPEGYSDIDSEYDNVEKKVFDGVGCGEETSEYDKMLYMIKKVKAEANTKDIDCSESEYYAAFIYKLCQEADMNASIVTHKTDDGEATAWVEVSLDSKMYKVDASKKDAKPEKYTPETTDYNPEDGE